MAATTSVSTPSQILFSELKDSAYQNAKSMLDSVHGEVSAADSKLGDYQTRLDTRSAELKAQTEGVPSQEVLLEEAIGFAREFEAICVDVNTTAAKAKVFAGEFARVIEFLTPKPRAYADVESAKQHATDLHELMTKTDAACSDYVKQLSESMTTLMTLQDKMLKQILGPTPSSLQAFCQIVDSKGQPKTWSQAAFDLIPSFRSAPIPTAASLQAKLDAVKAGAKKPEEVLSAAET